MKKLILGLFISVSFAGISQNNAVKLNLSLPNLILSNNVGFVYERKLSDRLAANVSLNFSSKQAAPLSGLLTEIAEPYLDSNDINTDIFNNKFSSFGFGFQLRYFPKKEALKGLYLAPYFGFQRNSIDPFDFDFPDKDNPGQTNGGQADISSTLMGVGLGIGNQWIIGKGLTVDIMWIGLGYGTSNLKIEGTERPGETVDFAEIDADVNNFLDNDLEDPFHKYGQRIESEYTDDYIKLTLKQGIPYTRLLNFSIGWSF